MKYLLLAMLAIIFVGCFRHTPSPNLTPCDVTPSQLVDEIILSMEKNPEEWEYKKDETHWSGWDYSNKDRPTLVPVCRTSETIQRRELVISLGSYFGSRRSNWSLNPTIEGIILDSTAQLRLANVIAKVLSGKATYAKSQKKLAEKKRQDSLVCVAYKNLRSR